jgi:hypothetical protein
MTHDHWKTTEDREITGGEAPKEDDGRADFFSRSLAEIEASYDRLIASYKEQNTEIEYLRADRARLRADRDALIAANDHLAKKIDALLAAAKLAIESRYTLYPYSMADVVRDALQTSITNAEELKP